MKKLKTQVAINDKHLESSVCKTASPKTPCDKRSVCIKYIKKLHLKTEDVTLQNIKLDLCDLVIFAPGIFSSFVYKYPIKNNKQMAVK